MEKPLEARPSRRLAVVACMDCRLDLEAALDLERGEAHLLRNAGGIVTGDTIRSLAISQRRLGTREVMVVHHTDCGMEGLDEEALEWELTEAAGAPPEFELGGFADAEEDVRRSVRLLRDSPFLPHRDRVRGFLYDVDTHAVREVEVGDEG